MRHILHRVVVLIVMIALAGPAVAANLRVMKQGLGSGTVTPTPAGINCGSDCDESSTTAILLTATADPGSVFARWEGDATVTTDTVTVTMGTDRSVRAVFDLTAPPPPLTDFTPQGIRTYLMTNTSVTTPAQFLSALPAEFKQNWIMMTRSESLQTGTAQFPRLLLPGFTSQNVFSIAFSTHASFPGAHPDAIEYMQWDAVEKNFRFHEIVLNSLGPMGNFGPRPRDVSIDDARCFQCHSTRNVLNRSTFPGTTGKPIGLVQAKNKPNWDTYDSWAGMLGFNRDRIYQGSVEAAAFRKLLNPWTHRANPRVRAIIEQLQLQPPGIVATQAITRTVGGADDGHINFPFDGPSIVTEEPLPTSSGTGPEVPIMTAYEFNRLLGTGATTTVTRGGQFVTLHHSAIPQDDEGRAVHFFDNLGGLYGNALNQTRVADEIANHRFATGNVPIDVRPIALAIARGLLFVDAPSNTVGGVVAAITIDQSFFVARTGMTINQMVANTQTRAFSLPRRKADLQRANLDRRFPDGPDAGTDPDLDPYLNTASNGLIQFYGTETAAGAVSSLDILRQEVFRRPSTGFFADRTNVMGQFVGPNYNGIYVDRELDTNIELVALFRFFLEPLGVSVDKWSMGVRGRSRTYTFADVLGTYLDVFVPTLRASLLANPVPGLMDPTDDQQVIAAVNSTLASLPAPGATPTYTDVQRIFNKSCVECHGGLGYPPYANHGSIFDVSEDEAPTAGNERLTRAHSRASTFINTIFTKITNTTEDCPFGLMPCGGPALSQTDVETIRRWMLGSTPFTQGDPHLRTVDGIRFDFQASGEFILLRDEGLELQARHTAVATNAPLGPDAYTGLTSCVSINTAVAVRVGQHRITYQPNLSGAPDASGLQLRVDGNLVQMSASGISLAGDGRIMPTTAPGGIQIEATGGTVIVVTPGWWNHYQVWYMNIDARQVRATEGLMGAIAPGNWLPALPDGTLLGPQPNALQDRYKDLYDRFGAAWRVTNTTSLFDYAPGTSSATFTTTGWPNGESPQACTLPANPPPQPALTLEAAQKACNDVTDPDSRDNCIKDVMATGDAGFATTYRLADQIGRNSPPTAPELVSPENYATGLHAPVKFVWKMSTDADGDPIRYRHYVWFVDDLPDNNQAVSVSTGRLGGKLFWVLVAVVVVLLILALLLLRANQRLAGLVALAIAAIVIALLLVRNLGAGNTAARTVDGLEHGKSYFWKVIAEDGKGGVTESEMWRFEMN